MMMFMVHKQICLIDDNNLKDMLETDASSSSKKHTYLQQSHKHLLMFLYIQSTLKYSSFKQRSWYTKQTSQWRDLLADRRSKYGTPYNQSFVMLLHCVKTFFTERRFILNKFQSCISYCVVPLLKNIEK